MECRTKESLNALHSLKTSNFVELRPIDLLRWEEMSDGSLRYVSDVTLLLNEDRIINDLGEDAYRNMVRSMSMPSKTYTSGAYDDDALLDSVKSRYIQKPSELSAWMASIVDRGEQIISEVRSAREAAEAAAIEAKAKELAAQSSETKTD